MQEWKTGELQGRPADYSIAVRCVACGLDEHGRVSGLLCRVMGQAFRLIDVIYAGISAVVRVVTFGRVR